MQAPVRCAASSTRSTATRLLLQLPADIVALRQTDELLARSWREVLREILVSAFADGYEVTGVTREGWYLLGR